MLNNASSTNNEDFFKHQLVAALQSLARGDFSARLNGPASGLDAAIAESFNAVARNQSLSVVKRGPSSLSVEKKIERDWFKATLLKFNRMLREQKDLRVLGKLIFTGLASMVSADHALFYVYDQAEETPKLKYLPCYSYDHDCGCFQQVFQVGEGRVGRCALEKKGLFFKETLHGCGKLDRAMAVIVLPILLGGQVKAVIELASCKGFGVPEQNLLDGLSESLGIILHAIESGIQTQGLLKKSQLLASELQEQQQQLQQTNRELEEKASMLALQKSEVEKKNREIEQARQALQEKAVQLVLTSKYKSEFLANMSHELRTPLNSMLLLARQLLENQEQTMTSKQVEFAKVIHGAGNELLRLINDILDLAKIESGTVTIDVSELQFWELQDFVERNFRELAKSKNLELKTELAPTLPNGIQTDGKRLEQILKNLLANAFKFTSKGGVSLRVFHASSGWSSENLALKCAANVVAFEVTDTGIGIPSAKQKLIFEAFQQGDGSTNRKFGGTGLGLTISREIALLLGGEIQLRSIEGEGSVFTLYLPNSYVGSQQAESKEGKKTPVEVFLRSEKSPWDDRGKLVPGDRVLLCVEDDVDFASCLLDMAREEGFKAVAATHGEQVMELVHRYKPSAITLDLTLPDMDGWKILERFKDNPSTRHIPVSIISGDEERIRGLKLGAMAFLVKPAPRSTLRNAILKMKRFQAAEQKRLLLVSEVKRDWLAGFSTVGVKIHAAHGGQAALAELSKRSFDCIVVDIDLPDMSGIHLLKELKQRRFRDLPIIVYSNRALTHKEQHHLGKLERVLLVKDVYSRERLIDQTALFLHLIVEKMPEADRRAIDGLHCNDTLLAGKNALIVDDDIRNIFAVTSLLERHGMQTASAESGMEALDMLKETVPDVILMDIMMPGLDGYETMRLVRKNKQFDPVPIIAVTAKAMREDRIKCLEAGASDYVPKPVDAQQLLSTLKLWLHR